MAKSIKVSISTMIELLEKQKAKGEETITLYGYIADKDNDYNLISSDKEAFEEQSYADWSLSRNGY
jgi:hypothetical protein